MEATNKGHPRASIAAQKERPSMRSVLYFTCYLQAEMGTYPGIQVAARLSCRVLWTLTEKTHSGRDAQALSRGSWGTT